MTACIYRGCGNNKLNYSGRFRVFPCAKRSGERFRRWLRNSGNEHLLRYPHYSVMLKSHHILCSDHFKLSSFVKNDPNLKLREYAYPISYKELMGENKNKDNNMNNEHSTITEVATESIITESVSSEAVTFHKCDVCNSKFYDLTLLNDHKSESGHYCCVIPGCDSKTFASITEVSMHNLRVHGSKQPLKRSMEGGPSNNVKPSKQRRSMVEQEDRLLEYNIVQGNNKDGDNNHAHSSITITDDLTQKSSEDGGECMNRARESRKKTIEKRTFEAEAHLNQRVRTSTKRHRYMIPRIDLTSI